MSTTAAEEDLPAALRDDAAGVARVAPWMFGAGFFVEAFSHSGAPTVAFFVAPLAAGVGLLLAATLIHRKVLPLTCPSWMLMSIWALSLGSMILHGNFADGELIPATLVFLASTMIGSAALIMPRGPAVVAIGVTWLTMLYFSLKTSDDVLSGIVLPLLVLVVALLIHLTRLNAIKQTLARKRLAVEVEAASTQLDYARKLSRMSGNIAHHLNNQLQGLLLATDGLRAADTRQDPSQEYLDIIDQGIARLTALSAALEGYAQAGVLEERSRFPAHTVVLQEELAGLIPQTVAFDVQAEATAAFLRGNLPALRQLLAELIQNAAEAVDPLDGRITLRGVVDGETYVLSVTDNGCGIPEQLLENAVEPFVSADPLQHFGLGLSFSDGVVRQLGGVLSLQRLAQGTRVTVTLPCEVIPLYEH